MYDRRSPPGDGPANARAIPECLTEGEAYVINSDTGDYSMPSEDAEVCYAMLTDDPAQTVTTTTTDDMSDLCADLNINLEFEIVRRPGFPAAGGTSISATSMLADFPELFANLHWEEIDRRTEAALSS